MLALVYYDCPGLCDLILNGLSHTMQQISLNVGTDYQVVTVSFNPKETWQLATAKKANYIEKYQRPGAKEGWHFLTGDEAYIKSLADAVGFHYKYDPANKQYAHAQRHHVITPEGKISRYFYGIEYKPRDFRLGLVEASANKIGTPADQVLLFCYHYDPTTGKYGVAITAGYPGAGHGHRPAAGRLRVHHAPARPALAPRRPEVGLIHAASSLA